MADTAKIREVRERTGVGFGDCKRALDECNWDIEEAIDFIRQQSAVKAQKKADRSAKEGLLALKISTGAEVGAIVEVNVETDFAARNERFRAFAQNVVERIVVEGEDALEKMAPDRDELIQVIGENVSLRRANRFTASKGTIVGYLHANEKVGSLVELVGGELTLGKDIAMHITAMSPIVVDPNDLPEDLIERERKIFSAQAAESGKPPTIAEKMVEGKLRKFRSEASLTDQAFVRTPEITVGKLLATQGATCVRFVRYEVGESIDDPS